PVHGRAPVPGRLGVEERARLRVLAEARLLLGRELRRLGSLERVHARALGRAGLEGANARGHHATLRGEILDARDVHGAPDARGLPRGEADGVGAGPEAAAYPVDPAEAERLVDRLGPGDAGLPGAALVEADEELLLGLVVGREPRAEVGRRGEVGRLHPLIPKAAPG